MTGEDFTTNKISLGNELSLSDIPAYIENQESLADLSERLEGKMQISLSEKDRVFLLKLITVYEYNSEQILELYQLGKDHGKIFPAYLEAIVKNGSGGQNVPDTVDPSNKAASSTSVKKAVNSSRSGKKRLAKSSHSGKKKDSSSDESSVSNEYTAFANRQLEKQKETWSDSHRGRH
ncbi:MAG: hypothetical protein IJT16_14455 [Lachnospiraceae bacterium]|nr:hypothetical protein [Lachnospiraceae bacterium]